MDCDRPPLGLATPEFQTVRQLLVPTPPVAACQVCVIVPARNEAANLPATLSALAFQVDLQQRPLDPAQYEVILLANNCTDDTAAIARDFARRHPALRLHVVEKQLPANEAYIGRVRQLLMDEAYWRLRSLNRSRGIIASTDGDSQVSPTWIAATQHEINSGADAVGGRILTDAQERSALPAYARSCHLREVGYCSLIAELEAYLDPDPHDCLPRHYQHYGASLAVTAEMYALAGGLPPVRTPEDVALYRALLRVNARFRHSPLVKVVTSARQTGRAAMGLAHQLREWSKMGEQRQVFWVESAEAIEAKLSARHKLRLLLRRMRSDHQLPLREMSTIAEALGVSTIWLVQSMMQRPTFGELYEQVEQRQQEEGIWRQRWPQVAIEQAVSDLRLRVAALRQKPISVLPMPTLLPIGEKRRSPSRLHYPA